MTDKTPSLDVSALSLGTTVITILSCERRKKSATIEFDNVVRSPLLSRKSVLSGGQEKICLVAAWYETVSS